MRRLLCHEPRGHADMYGCFIVPPDDDGADFGVLFWHKDGYSTACGHGTIALGAWAVESGRVAAPADGEVEVTIDVPSGRVVARVTCRAGAVERVAFRNVPAYVIARGVDAGGVRVDVAYGGAIYAFVPATELGLPLSAAALPELIRAGREIKAALEGTDVAVHPDDPRLSGIYGTVIHEELGPAHHRNVVVFADGEVDRSPTGSATSARTALLADDGVLDDGASWRNDSDHRDVVPRHPGRPRRRRRAHRGRGHGVPDGRAPLRPRPARRPRHRLRAALGDRGALAGARRRGIRQAHHAERVGHADERGEERDEQRDLEGEVARLGVDARGSRPGSPRAGRRAAPRAARRSSPPRPPPGRSRPAPSRPAAGRRSRPTSG